MKFDWSRPWIVFFGDQWEHKRRRRQQIALYLAKHMNCSGLLYIENALTLTSWLKWKFGKADPEAKSRWERVKRNGTLMRMDDISGWVLTPIIPFRLTGVPLIDSFHHFCIYIRALRAWEKITGQWFFWRQIAIVTHPWWPLSLYRRMGLHVDLYDCTDDFSKVYDLPERIKEMVSENDRVLTTESATVTCVSRQLVQEKYAARLNSEHCIHIPNGVDHELYIRASEQINDTPAWRSKCGDSLVLGYVGGINRRVDVELLKHIAEIRPDWRIAIAGRSEYVQDYNLHNLIIVGELGLDEVPNFLDAVDVCIIPHKVDDLTGSMSPQKIYDYLASGKPIVTTPVAGTEDFPELLYVASTYDQFITAIESAVTSDDENLRSQRRIAARENSWQVRGEQFAGILSNQRVVTGKAA